MENSIIVAIQMFVFILHFSNSLSLPWWALWYPTLGLVVVGFINALIFGIVERMTRN